MRTLLSALALVSLFAAPTFAAPCKDPKGRFVKCVKPAPAAVKKAPCKDAHGKFTKCPK